MADESMTLEGYHLCMWEAHCTCQKTRVEWVKKLGRVAFPGQSRRVGTSPRTWDSLAGAAATLLFSLGSSPIHTSTIPNTLGTSIHLILFDAMHSEAG